MSSERLHALSRYLPMSCLSQNEREFSHWVNRLRGLCSPRRKVTRCLSLLLAVSALIIASLDPLQSKAQETTTSSAIKFLGSSTASTTHLFPVVGQASLLAVDGIGNIYYSDTAQNSVVSMPLGGGVKKTILTGVPSIRAMAADYQGDVFVTSDALNHVVEFQASSGKVMSLGSGLLGAGSLTVTPQGAIDVADTGNNRIVSILPSGVMTVLYNGINAPTAVYADGAGDLYIGNSSGIIAVWTNGQVDRIGQHFSLPVSITQAGSSNLYVVDSGTQQLIETAAGTGQQTPLLGAEDGVVISSVIGTPSGDLYAFDQKNAQIIKLDAQLAMGASRIGVPSALHTLNFEFTTTVSLGSILPVTQGVNDGELIVAGGSCLTNYVYFSGDQCTIVTSALIAHAGAWNGDLTLTDHQGNDLLDYEFFGTGLAPVMAILPGTAQTIYANSYSYGGELIPSSLAIDAADNVYIGDDANQRVLKVSATGSASVLLAGSSTTAGSLQDPLAIALDGKGNVFVANQSAAIGINPNLGSPSTLEPTLFTAIRYGQWGYRNSFVAFMTGLVVQLDGGFVFSDSGNNRVVAVDPTGAGMELISNTDPIGPNKETLGYPLNLAYDPGRNLLVVDYDNNRIVRRSKGGTLSEVFPEGTDIAGQPLSAPMGLAVDPAGNLYIADTGNNRIVGLTPQGYSWTILDESSSIDGANDLPLNNPQTIALDSHGNLYVADVGNERVIKISRSSQNLDFGQSDIGTNLVLPVTVQNIGNLDLTLGQPTIAGSPTDFSLIGATDCAMLPPVTTGNACRYDIQYGASHIGLSLGVLAIPSNSQTASGSTTMIQLIGESRVGVDHLALASQPTKLIAGSSFSYTVRAEDPQGNLVTGYQGSISMSWLNEIPHSSYIFTDADAGSHTFSGKTLKLAGVESLTIKDKANSGLTVSGETVVFAGAPATLTVLAGDHQSVLINTALTPLVVSTHDAFGNLVPGAFVTFASPTKGPSAAGTIGNLVTPDFTDSTGTSFAYLHANGQTGDYIIVATLSTGAEADFSITNEVATPIGGPAFTILAQPQITSFDQLGVASSKVSVSPLRGFSGTVKLACQAPEGVSCELSSIQIPISGNVSSAWSVVEIRVAGAKTTTTTIAKAGLLFLVVFLTRLPLTAFNRSRTILHHWVWLLPGFTFLLVLGCGAGPNTGTSVNSTLPVSKPIKVTVIAVDVSPGTTVPTASVDITINPYKLTANPVPHPPPCRGGARRCTP
jgi:hypothetical protein